MEVHKHPHHVTHKKKWGEYLIEFFMLFLAVFLGFIAENIRETSVERHREKEYIHNMLEDLKTDTASYSLFTQSAYQGLQDIDSLMVLCKSNKSDTFNDRIYYLARIITTRFPNLVLNERTYEQMKSSGLLRLLLNGKVAKKVSDYYNQIKVINAQNEAVGVYMNMYSNTVGKVLDADVMLQIFKDKKVPTSTKLISTNKADMNQFLTAAQYLYGSTTIQIRFGKERDIKAKNLIALIKDEYKFE